MYAEGPIDDNSHPSLKLSAVSADLLFLGPELAKPRQRLSTELITFHRGLVTSL